jgi:hypothetical protein
VVHFSGHGGDSLTGLFFQGSEGRAQRASAKAIEEVFGAAGRSVQVVVLNGLLRRRSGRRAAGPRRLCRGNERSAPR